MPRDFSMENVSGMLDGLKSRLGFTREEDRYAPDEYEGYDEYDYGEYDDYDASYDEDGQVGGYMPATAGSTRATSRFGRADSSPNLVSFDDVKYSTPMPELRPSESRAHTTGSYSSTTNVGGHTVIDATVPVPSSPAYKAAVRDGYVKNDPAASTYSAAATATSVSSALAGADASSLAGASGAVGSVGAAGTSGAAGSSASPSRGGFSYDPYEAYSSSKPSTYAQARALTVVRPVAYGDVERVARAVKSGDVVVLAMRNTPDDLSKRILDFSFGVASALDANVECPGSKVFAIARGNALTEDEKRRLRAQGVL